MLGDIFTSKPRWRRTRSDAHLLSTRKTATHASIKRNPAPIAQYISPFHAQLPEVRLYIHLATTLAPTSRRIVSPMNFNHATPSSRAPQVYPTRLFTGFSALRSQCAFPSVRLLGSCEHFFTTVSKYRPADFYKSGVLQFQLHRFVVPHPIMG